MPPLSSLTTISIGVLWLAFLVVWAVGAFRTHQTKREEALGSRAFHIGLLAAGSAFLWPGVSLGFASVPLLARGAALHALAVALVAGGVGLAIWARAQLGRNWSGTVTLKQGHALVLRGPYRFVRHPIYTGITTAILGTGLWLDEVRGLLAVACFLAAFAWKIRLEERWLVEEFGESYREYQRATKALIPFVF
jgi:protein-S-isoprenylcysteine O-methyltransferase Ste14